MTRLPPPEQWVLSKMSEMEVAEMIEEHIDYYTVDEDGTRRSVHLPTPFVRHFMKRSDRVLPTVVAIATSPIVLADGGLLAPDGLDRLRGIQFIIQDELRSVILQRKDCAPECVKAAMEFLCDEWLVDVATDYVGRAWKPAESVAWLSPFRYYMPFELVMGSALSAKNLYVLGGIAVAAFTLAYVLYLRRDISH